MNDVIKRNNVNVISEGEKVMMFVHGYGCDQNMWRFVTPAFKDEYKIVLFDQVGSGKSDEKSYDFDKYSSLQGYADDILEIANVLNLKNITLVGHSVSSMIGLLAVIKEPDIFENLIMIGPSPRYINDENYLGGFEKKDIEELIESLDSNYLGWSSAITPVIMGNPDKPELTEELTNSFCRNNPEIAKHFAKVTFMGDNREDLSKLKVRTLVLQCTTDALAPVKVGKYVAEKIPDSRLVMIETTGHCPHMSNPDQTIKAMKEFLSEE